MRQKKRQFSKKQADSLSLFFRKLSIQWVFYLSCRKNTNNIFGCIIYRDGCSVVHISVSGGILPGNGSGNDEIRVFFCGQFIGEPVSLTVCPGGFDLFYKRSEAANAGAADRAITVVAIVASRNFFIV